MSRETRAMQDDDTANPGMLWVLEGESLWNKKGALHPLPVIKYWMELNGMSAGPVRPPMHNLTEQQKTEFRERLEASGWTQRLYPKQAKKAAA